VSIEPVIDNMDQLIEVHDALLELGLQKKEILIANHTDRLNQIVLKEIKLVKKIETLEIQRITAIGSFLLTRGYNSNPKITISDLVKVIFKIEEKQRLQLAQQTLLHKVHDLQQVNKLNQQLIKQSLAFIDYSIDLMTGSPSDDLFYNPAQQRSNSKRSSYFDIKG
jgi:flagellar biosynthesis/type III secretory pathway chaperone